MNGNVRSLRFYRKNFAFSESFVGLFASWCRICEITSLGSNFDGSAIQSDELVECFFVFSGCLFWCFYIHTDYDILVAAVCVPAVRSVYQFAKSNRKHAKSFENSRIKCLFSILITDLKLGS